jgi:hypothetical protein
MTWTNVRNVLIKSKVKNNKNLIKTKKECGMTTSIKEIIDYFLL